MVLSHSGSRVHGRASQPKAGDADPAGGTGRRRYEDPLPSDGTLAQRVDALPPEVGTIIKLRFYEDLSLKEISTVTGWNLNTVKTRLYTGLKKLRISMEGDQL